MAIQTMTTAAARIGKVKGDMLKHAMPMEVLCKMGMQKKLSKNESDTVIYRRALPPGGVDNIWISGANVDTFADTYKLSEGTTPTARTISYVDVTAVVEQYGVLYSITDKTFDLYEDDVSADMKKQVGETVGLIREMICYGALKAGTNKFYAGGTSTATVDLSLSLNLIRKVVKSLQKNHAKRITSILDASGNYGTSSVEAAYVVFTSTDMAPAIRDLPGFVQVADYGNRKMVSEGEIGTCEEFRFVITPELAPYIDAGAAVGATGLFSTSGTLIDVYPVIVAAEEAWGNVMLRGMDSINPTWVPPGVADKADPLGQRGYVGAKFYYDALVLNQGWMAVIECGTPDLA
ncbi:MAG: N4-gp56 family major capsid protein [Methylotenera sp.]|nr:MAG: N4-gp56 family major capsid protein [Methylotenera sp.]